MNTQFKTMNEEQLQVVVGGQLGLMNPDRVGGGIVGPTVGSHWSDGIAGAVGIVNEHNKKNYKHW